MRLINKILSFFKPKPQYAITTKGKMFMAFYNERKHEYANGSEASDAFELIYASMWK